MEVKDGNVDQAEFVEWLSAVGDLSEVQRAEAGRALAGQQPLEEVVQMLEPALFTRVC